jgi:hypothetical protein
VNVSDTELIFLLEKRDGPLPQRSWSHASEGECRYSELYEGQACPWCEAAKRRAEQEAAAT